MKILGLDIGGANIKAATVDGDSVSTAFPIWKNERGLADTLRELPLLSSAVPQLVALTMTAELADCFSSKSEGVSCIIRTVTDVFPGSLVRVWMTSGEFAEPHDAIELPELTGAANWHALATWVGRSVPRGPALLIDVGSTTTDVIPLFDGIPVPEGRTDLMRLASLELLYTGARRTPVSAIVRNVPLVFPGKQTLVSDDDEELFVPIAAEMFATALDVHLLNGDIPSDDSDSDTADGRPASRGAALNRLAHMLCCDSSELSEAQLQHISRFIAQCQIFQISQAVRDRAAYVCGMSEKNASDEKARVLVCGSGEWLAERAVKESGAAVVQPVTSLSDMFFRNVSTCATAFAVARLAAERCADDFLPQTTLS